MELLVAAAIFTLALAIVIAALIIRSVITAMISAFQQTTVKQQEHLAESRQSFITLCEMLMKLGKRFDRVGEYMEHQYLQIADYNNYGQFNKLVSAVQDGCAALEKLVPTDPEQGKEKQ